MNDECLIYILAGAGVSGAVWEQATWLTTYWVMIFFESPPSQGAGAGSVINGATLSSSKLVYNIYPD